MDVCRFCVKVAYLTMAEALRRQPAQLPYWSPGCATWHTTSQSRSARRARRRKRSRARR